MLETLSVTGIAAVCAIGAAVGIALALAASQVLGSLLYGIGSSDPPAYVVG